MGHSFHGRRGKYPTTFILLLFSFLVYGQEPPQALIIQPLNGTVFDGEHIKVDYFVAGTEPKSARIMVDDRPVQLLTEVKTGQNTVIVELPARDCKISIIVQNEFGASVPAVVNLKRNEQIFKPTLYVLAIGISNYDNPDLRLQFPAKDAVDFSMAMLRQQGVLYEKVELRLLTDEQANAENIRDGLQWMKTETTYRDVAMLYMAGHGINNNVGDFFFMPVNADIDRLNATCVGYREIKETLDANAGKLLVFMDACHSGNVLGGNQQRAAMLSQAISELTGADNGAVIFTSSTGRQFSLENSEWNNGAFTKALVEGLNGAADLFGRKTITVKNLESYVANRVKELTKGQQAPTTIIPNSVPDFPIAVVNITVNVTVLPPTSPPQQTNSPAVETLSSTNMLTAIGRNVYYNHDVFRKNKLEKSEVLKLMENANASDAYFTYKKSISRNRIGNILLISGTILTGAGILQSASGIIIATSNDPMVGAAFITSGVGSIITGTTMKIKSRKYINQSVDMYNSGINKPANTELKFGITGNGVGLALSF